jgi:hypothetical protein
MAPSPRMSEALSNPELSEFARAVLRFSQEREPHRICAEINYLAALFRERARAETFAC